MAIHPADPDWEDVARAALDQVLDWASTGTLGTYGELADHVNDDVPDAKLEPFGFAMGRLLYDLVITVRTFDPQAPMVSSVVVLKDSGEPGGGFWTLGEQLGLYDRARGVDRSVFWAEQLRATFDYWTRERRRDLGAWVRRHGMILYGDGRTTSSRDP